MTAPSLFPSLRASDSFSSSHSTPFSSSTGIRQLLWFPLHPFLLLHGYQTDALVPAPPLFPPPRVSDRCFGSRSTPFSSSTGIRQLLWFPLHPFFLLHGYQTDALVPAPPLFPPPRVSDSCSGFRSMAKDTFNKKKPALK
jgi:hypothetical protein